MSNAKSIATLAQSIMSADLSRDDLNVLINAINAKSRMLSQVAKYAFRPRQRVEFTNSRNGLTVKGSVVKLMPKNIRVLADDGRTWTVSPSLLRASA